MEIKEHVNQSYNSNTQSNRNTCSQDQLRQFIVGFGLYMGFFFTNKLCIIHHQPLDGEDR